MTLSSFKVEVGGLELKITLEELSKLHIHEEIIPEMLDALVKKIQADKVFKDPVIVDEKTLVVLDGMHRVAASKRLGFKYIPVCLVNYDDPRIKLYAWSRGIVGIDVNKLMKVVNEVGFTYVKLGDVKEALRELRGRRYSVLIVTRGDLYGLVSNTQDIKSVYDRVKFVEEAVKQESGAIYYFTEEESIEKVSRGEIDLALIPTAITKEEVRSVALRGEVFIHKATRHVIPARPLGINVPLEWLKDTNPLSDLRTRLVEYLSRRRFKKLPPGTVLDRRYDEELLVFE